MTPAELDETLHDLSSVVTWGELPNTWARDVEIYRDYQPPASLRDLARQWHVGPERIRQCANDVRRVRDWVLANPNGLTADTNLLIPARFDPLPIPGVSVRLATFVRNQQCSTLRDVVEMFESWQSVRRQPNFGRVIENELRRLLVHVGLSFEEQRVRDWIVANPGGLTADTILLINYDPVPGVSGRLAHCIENENCLTLREFAETHKSWRSVKRVPNLGRSCVEELDRLLSQVGLSLEGLPKEPRPTKKIR